MDSSLDVVNMLIESERGDSPFRPSREVLISGVNRSMEFLRILALPRRAEEITTELLDALTRHLKTDDHRRWGAIRRQWHEIAREAGHGSGDDEIARERAFEAVPEARQLPEIVHRVAHDPDKAQEALRPIQGRAIADAFHEDGLFAPIGVGHGKFLISVLLITLVEDARARDGLPPLRWLLLVPANLIEQTKNEIAKARRHWRMPAMSSAGSTGLVVASYDKLSSVKSRTLILDDGQNGNAVPGFQPDRVICDEVQKLKRTGSGRTRLFLRYFRVRPQTKLYAMSGTVTKKKIRDYWHIIHLTLPAQCPLPKSFEETEAWSQAIDDLPDSEYRRAPGALLEFCAAAAVDAISPGWSAAPQATRLAYYGETQERQAAILDLVRTGYQRRLRETPGVVGTTDSALGTALVIAERVPPPAPQCVRDAFEKMRRTWQTPNGDEIDGGISMWRHACELTSGFWYRWDPVAPPEWLAARQDWNRFVRYVLAHNRQRLDTPLQVVQAVDAGKLSASFKNGDVFLAAWRGVRETFEPNPRPEWISDWLIVDALAWLDEQVDEETNKPIPNRCVMWVGLDAVGRAIESMSGGRVRYFGGGAQASSEILSHVGPIVCSIAAHGTGKNLQRFDRNLVLHWPSGGDVVEQLLGRTHRPGQESDEIRVAFYAHALELRNAFVASIRSADYIQASTGSMQKLSYATIVQRDAEDVDALVVARDPLWYKPPKK